MGLVGDILQLAIQRNVMLTCAESCTGGMVGAALTDLAGSSAMFDRGFITYSNAAKIQMLGVLPATLAAHGAVSIQVAREMAQGALERSDAALAVSITGIAGPGGSEHKPEGRVCFAIAQTTGVIAETQEFGAPGRDGVRQAATDHALNLLRNALHKME
ncbi:CinA family protein [Sulfitobacter sp. F26204]|uniref:CinA family protein n=1 Tax=Sulfitobacter sp. F26204 TaxID=2996014 RepID=UPI00225DEC0A|nr:CinA family protein [Sulfitobacter sp. F26204]MCX7559880.1 CinA family protein [Sulfitobacter sp. F26204]